MGPKESGIGFPSWWVTGAVFFTLAAIPTLGFSLLLALLCVYFARKRIKSSNYQALKTLEAAKKAPSERTDYMVQQAADRAPDSWTVQREAGLYFSERKNPERALHHLNAAIHRFPGDKRPYLILAANAATDARQFDYSIQALEPYLGTCDPANDSIDALMVGLLALALQKAGDSGRALEVVNRLPLRRRNLDQPLLFGLCVRAMAKDALGKKADAKRDVDRVYSIDPNFPMLAETQRVMENDGKTGVEPVPPVDGSHSTHSRYR